MTTSQATRRNFLKSSAAFTTGISGLMLLPSLAWSADEGVNIIGPKSGYSPQIGTLVSMLTWMRPASISSFSSSVRMRSDGSNSASF